MTLLSRASSSSAHPRRSGPVDLNLPVTGLMDKTCWLSVRHGLGGGSRVRASGFGQPGSASPIDRTIPRKNTRLFALQSGPKLGVRLAHGYVGTSFYCFSGTPAPQNLGQCLGASCTWVRQKYGTVRCALCERPNNTRGPAVRNLVKEINAF